MQRVFPIAAALVLFACGPAFAQMASMPGVPTTRSTAAVGLMNPMPSLGGVGSGLGAIPLSSGSLIPATGSALGSITTCPLSGPGATTDSTIDVGGMPGSTTGTGMSAIAPFGTSALAGTCNPSTPAITQGFSNAAPPPSPGTITGYAFTDGAFPLDATEAGGGGLSPMIAVPDPATSATSCNGGSTMMESPAMPTLFDNAGATGMSTPSGC